MGETDVRNTNSNIEQSESKSDSTKIKSSGNRSSKTTGTGNGSGTVGRGSGSIGTGSGKSETGSGTVGTGTAKTIKAEKSPKVSVLNDLPEVNIPSPEAPKQKRKYTKRVKEENTGSFDSKQITAFIVAVSSVVASREGCSHWIVTETEAEQIAKPLSNIIAKSEHLKTLGEHADAFALVSACLMIFAPRLIISLQNKKAKKGVKKINGKHNDTKSSHSNKEVSRTDAVTPSADGQSIFESISAIQ